MHHIEQDSDAHAVCFVYEILKVIRISLTARRRIKTADLVAERTIVRMLHNRHELNSVISGLLYVWQDVIRELPVGCDAVVLARHSDVGLVNQRGFIALKTIIGPVIVLHIPDLAAPALGVPVLSNPECVYGDVLREVAAVVYYRHNTASRLKGVTRQEYFPVAVIEFIERGIRPVPVVEISCEIELVCARSPLAVHPASFFLMKAIIFMRIRKVLYGL